MPCPSSGGGLLEKAAFTRALGHFLRKWEEPPLTPAPCGPGIWEWTVSPRPARPGGPRLLRARAWGPAESLMGLAERLGGGDGGTGTRPSLAPAHLLDTQRGRLCVREAAGSPRD